MRRSKTVAGRGGTTRRLDEREYRQRWKEERKMSRFFSKERLFRHTKGIKIKDRGQGEKQKKDLPLQFKHSLSFIRIDD